jgi:hypothetical protein
MSRLSCLGQCCVGHVHIVGMWTIFMRLRILRIDTLGIVCPTPPIHKCLESLMHRLIFAVMTVLSLMSTASADCVNGSSSRVSCTGSVLNLFHDDLDRTYFSVRGVDNSTNCTSGDFVAGGTWQLRRSSPHYATWYSLVLASSVAGNTLHVVSNSAVGGSCSIQRIELRS